MTSAVEYLDRTPSRHWLKIKTAAGQRVDDERLRHVRALTSYRQRDINRKT
jgi:hypothetical protein